MEKKTLVICFILGAIVSYGLYSSGMIPSIKPKNLQAYIIEAHQLGYKAGYDIGFGNGAKEYIDTHIVEGPCIINDDLTDKNILIYYTPPSPLTVSSNYVTVSGCYITFNESGKGGLISMSEDYKKEE